MRAAGAAFLDALDDAGREAVGRPHTDEDRRVWTYLPGDRPGVRLGELAPKARKLAHRLLATAVSRHTFAQITTIMGLEEVLDLAEGGNRGRVSDGFWLIFFGDPADELWTWRFEGHHVSVTMTVAGEDVSPTPLFLGANPAIVGYGGRPVVRPLPLEEELARELLTALTPAQHTKAVVAERAPDDIRTRFAPEIADPGDIPGVRGADLPRDAADRLTALISLYADRLPPALATEASAGLDLDRATFAWEGPTARGAGHYYRVHTPGLLIEYDNTQNDANHIHAVLRRPGDDFGARLLTRHQATETHPT
ncbi:MAG: DUF3500 domain-containing protein [Streptosporangiales bacterium]|nr:DUF3500 domain-containing protein [Streptosporangiales bacterium]